MRLVFMGTPDFAACSLQKLIDERFEVAGVFCQPDKPQNRGHRIVPCAVKRAAQSAGIPVYQPAKMRDGTALAILQKLAPEIIVVVAYGRILPEDILALPVHGCVNVHASLLPKYRGSAPVQRAVLNGEKRTGVTTMYLCAGMDEGDMIYQAETVIGEQETSGQLLDRLAPMGAALLVKTLRSIEAGATPRVPQNSAEATYAPPLSRAESPIDWTQSAQTVQRHIYGMQPWPCATARIGGVVCKIFAAKLTGCMDSASPGTVISSGQQGIEVVCGDGQTVLLTELQAPGGRRMTAASYLLGHPIEIRQCPEELH